MLCSGVWNLSNGQRQRSWFVWQRRWLEKILKCTQSSAPGDAGLGCEEEEDNNNCEDNDNEEKEDNNGKDNNNEEEDNDNGKDN